MAYDFDVVMDSSKVFLGVLTVVVNGHFWLLVQYYKDGNSTIGYLL